MIKYAPLIDEEAIPAFYDDTLTIQIKNNPAVDPKEVVGFRAIIKDFITGKIITSVDGIEEKGSISFGENANFKGELTPGNFYKFQVCYLYLEKDNTKVESPYSYTTIGRYLGREDNDKKISVSFIEKEEDKDKTLHIFTGSDLQNNENLGERIYQYCFELKNITKKVLDTSGWQFYTDTTPKFTTYYNYTSGAKYTITYSIITHNGYETSISSEPFTATGITPDDNFTLTTNQNDTNSLENGYVNVNVNITNGSSLENYEVLRKVVTEDFWEKIYSFANADSSANVRDNTVIQGIPYEYACCSPNGYLIAPAATSVPIFPKFDHMFLSDKERQLCIRFNPKVNSYKQTILEQKLDTIDGIYPTILRNGQTRYREIGISGLISFHMDNNFFFWNKEKAINKIASNSNIFTTNLSYENFAIEREFRNEVVEWLNNGEPKLFRSPAEGNMIVRLMNVSISPNEQLGRMIYSFSATGYEVEDIKDGIEKYVTESLQI